MQRGRKNQREDSNKEKNMAKRKFVFGRVGESRHGMMYTVLDHSIVVYDNGTIGEVRKNSQAFSKSPKKYYKAPNCVEIITKTKILLLHKYCNQIYLVQTTKHTLSQIYNILAYIQKVNNEVCSSFELSVLDICKILVEYFDFELQDINYYEKSRKEKVQAFCSTKGTQYSVVMDMKIDRNIHVVELTNFWNQYNMKYIPEEVVKNTGIEKKIKDMVWSNPNAQPWL